jgi:hypothetical protein
LQVLPLHTLNTDVSYGNSEFIFCSQPTPYSRNLLEKLMVPHLVKKFYGFCEKRRFITAAQLDPTFRHINRVQAPILFLKFLFNIISNPRVYLPTGLLPRLPHKTLYAPLPSSVLHDPLISLFFISSPE